MNKNNKIKIIVDGDVFGAASDNVLARTGVYFVTKSLCDIFNLRNDVELKIFSSPEIRHKLLLFFKKTPLIDCFDLRDLKFGKEKLNFLMPFYPASPDFYRIPMSSIFQIVYDFSFHACSELKNGDKKRAEKQLVQSLNSKGYALCVSENTRNDLLSIFDFPKERTSVFYPGLRSDIFENIDNKSENNDTYIKKFLKIPEDSQYVLCLSTIEPRKNLENSIKAFELATETLGTKNLYFVMVGAKGWGQTKEYINKLPLKLKKKIIITGYLKDKYIPSLYKSALCFLFPSLYEGFGMPPLEAIACGTPVITSNRGSLPEIFSKCTKIFDPYDINGISDMINFWNLNPQSRNNEIIKSKKIIKNFTWHRATDQIINFINKVTYTK